MIQIDMPMPEKCGLCPCFHFDNPIYCQAVKADKNKKIVSPYGSPRPEWCPLKEQEAKPVGKEWNECPNCGKVLSSIEHIHFCGMCGQEVKWE